MSSFEDDSLNASLYDTENSDLYTALVLYIFNQLTTLQGLWYITIFGGWNA